MRKVSVMNVKKLAMASVLAFVVGGLVVDDICLHLRIRATEESATLPAEELSAVAEAAERTETWIEASGARGKMSGYKRCEQWLGKKLRGLKVAAKSKWTGLRGEKQTNTQVVAESAAEVKQTETPEKK